MLKITSPIFLFLTLTGVKGFVYATADSEPFLKRNPIDRDILFLPEYIIENYNEKAEKILKESFNALWNAVGYPRDLYYDKDDNWNPPKT